MTFHWLQFASRAWGDTLIGKNLLPQREQILSCKSVIPNPWKELEHIIPASSLHSTTPVFIILFSVCRQRCQSGVEAQSYRIHSIPLNSTPDHVLNYACVISTLFSFLQTMVPVLSGSTVLQNPVHSSEHHSISCFKLCLCLSSCFLFTDNGASLGWKPSPTEPYKWLSFNDVRPI